MDWKLICRLADIPKLGARRIEGVAGEAVAIFRTNEDKVFAMVDSCPHKGGLLSQGMVFGDRVACPLHNWQIGFHDACAIAPDQGCVKSFPVKLVDGDVYLGE